MQCALAMEEIASGCGGIANLIGAHYLGVMPLLLAVDLHLLEQVMGDMTAAERRGEAVLCAAAITEPDAGTDVEDEELLRAARLCTFATPVNGGYRITGRKVFISNGSVARYTTLICAIDRHGEGRRTPAENWTAFVVPADAPGFSVVRVENKMGQRASHAAELCFDDCFVPASHRLGPEGGAIGLVELTLAGSRGAVAAIATGIAHGAYRAALELACRQPAGRGLLSDRPWVQQAFAEMYASIELSRGGYIASTRAFDEGVVSRLLGPQRLVGPVVRASRPLRRTTLGRAITGSDGAKTLGAGMLSQRLAGVDVGRYVGYSSAAKFAASDIAVDVCLRALEVLGPAGAEERTRVEKCLRDARLTQIYEGTNQLNRHAAFRGAVHNGEHA